MANQSEYDDIRTEKDFIDLAVHLKAVVGLAHEISRHSGVPAEIRGAAFKVEVAAEESIAFIVSSPLADLKREPSPEKQDDRVKHKRRRTGETTKGIIEFANAVRKEPSYKSAEFKCIDDFDKCKEKRGKNSALCHLALFICMGKRIIPFVRQK